jgi:4-carboxymuconolactone decarboxylase
MKYKSIFLSGILIANLQGAAMAAEPTKEIKKAATLDDIKGLAPEFAKLTQESLFGDIWKRPGISQRDKSLVTIVTLATQGRTEQIDYHLGFGLDNGLTEKEIVAAMTQLAYYAGWPAAMTGLTHLQDVLNKRKSEKK